MNDKRIISAAILEGTGELFVGKNHAEALRERVFGLRKFGYSDDNIKKTIIYIEDGFLCSDKLFYNRADSYQIANLANQLVIAPDGRLPHKMLPSIDNNPQLDSSSLKLTEEDLELARSIAKEYPREKDCEDVFIKE